MMNLDFFAFPFGTTIVIGLSATQKTWIPFSFLKTQTRKIRTITYGV